jgi:thioredoxin reductase
MSCCGSRPTAAAIETPKESTAAAVLPVAIIGAGPIGLAAAAELAARSLPFQILEAGPGPGASVRAWSHVQFFSPWSYAVSRPAAALLQQSGWRAPDPQSYPTGKELMERYLEPLAAHPAIAPHLRTNRRVTAIARTGTGKVRDGGREARPFEIRSVDAVGREARLLARAVIDASGTWTRPNPAGASGLPALGEAAAAERLRYGIPDVLGAERSRYQNRRVAVLGGGHSAAGTLIDLAKLAEAAPRTEIVWLLRRRDFSTVFGSENDQLAERGALGQRLKALSESGRLEIVAPFALESIERGADGRLQLGSESRENIVADELIVATGFRPDLSFLGELRLDLDPALECPRALGPLIDPNLHSCGTVRPHGARELQQPESGFYLAGMKAYGRAPTFLLLTGYEQVRSIAAALAGDQAAADRVELVLPETGVCSGAPESTAAACCGPARGGNQVTPARVAEAVA